VIRVRILNAELHMTEKCRVLIVEDEAAVSMLMEDMVLDFGTEIVGPAASLEEAMALVRLEHIDAAILDVNVRGTMAFEVADQMREAGIPVIFATGYGVRVIPPRLQDAPILTKPFRYEAMKDALKKALADAPCEVGQG
jgi:DNA-binding NtrC family response regulator